MIIKNANDLWNAPVKIEKVEIPELGTCHFRAMSGTAKATIEQYYIDGYAKHLAQIRGETIAACLCDDCGALLLKDASAVNTLMQLPATIIEDLFTAATKASKISDEDIEATEKNSEAGA